MGFTSRRAPGIELPAAMESSGSWLPRAVAVSPPELWSASSVAPEAES
jgi:hypothetical protein